MLRTVYITQFVTAPIQAKFALLVRFEIRLIFFTQWICPITCKPLSLEAESGFCTTYRAAHEQVVIHKKKSTKCTMADQSVPLHLTSKKTNDVQICTWRHCYEKTTTSTICICKTKQTNKVRSSNWRRFGCTTMCGKPRDTGPGSLLAPFVSLSSSALSPSLFTPQRPSFQHCETSSWCTLCTTIQSAPAMRSYWSGHMYRGR